MNVSGIHAAAQISMMKKSMDQQSTAAQKLISGMDKASAMIQANSNRVEPGKGGYIDVYA